MKLKTVAYDVAPDYKSIRKEYFNGDIGVLQRSYSVYGVLYHSIEVSFYYTWLSYDYDRFNDSCVFIHMPWVLKEVELKQK